MVSPIVTVVAWLNQQAAADGDPVVAYGIVPNPRPDRFIRVMRGGTTVLTPAHRDVRLVVECWDSAGELAADELGDRVAGWLAQLDVPGSHVPPGPAGFFGGPYAQPDPDSGCPRSVMTVNLRQRRP